MRSIPKESSEISKLFLDMKCHHARGGHPGQVVGVLCGDLSLE